MIASILLAAVTSLSPILTSSAPWANAPGPPPTTGRVTIVDVFTFECINCKHVVPELQRLRTRISSVDLAIVGVHAPELPEERVHANVVRGCGTSGSAGP